MKKILVNSCGKCPLWMKCSATERGMSFDELKKLKEDSLKTPRVLWNCPLKNDECHTEALLRNIKNTLLSTFKTALYRAPIR